MQRKQKQYMVILLCTYVHVCCIGRHCQCVGICMTLLRNVMSLVALCQKISIQAIVITPLHLRPPSALLVPARTC